MMPAVFAHAWPADFAKPHFDFVGDDRRENQILAAQTFAFTECQRRGDEIARVAGIGFPVNVVVIHRADHVTIDERCVDRICLEAGNKCGGRLAIAAARSTITFVCHSERSRGISGIPSVVAAHPAIMFQQNSGVFLLTAAKGAADGIEPE